MYKNLTKWLGVTDNTEVEEVAIIDANGKERIVRKQVSPNKESDNTETLDESQKEESQEQENDDLISPETKQRLEDASAKAVTAAKEWGNLLYTFGKHATEMVAEKAKEISRSVEEKTFLGDFTREQDKYAVEQMEIDKQSKAAVPPWVGFDEEETMKSQILALSQDKRNFLRNPPVDIQFQFDFDTVFPIAMATLKEDPNLQQMRFELVPKQIKEVTFWRNYFFRVYQLQHSTQPTSFAQISDMSPHNLVEQREIEEELEGESLQHDLAIDTFQSEVIGDEELEKEMKILGMEEGFQNPDDPKEQLPEWELELKQRLQDYEMVNSVDVKEYNDIENEILKQIKEESVDT